MSEHATSSNGENHADADQQTLQDDFTALRLEETGDRLHVILDRPEVRNAIDQTMVDELHTVCDYLERNPKIMILSGTEVNGKGIFASGADIAQLRERRREDALRGVNSQIFDRIAKLPMPVIAALDGDCRRSCRARATWPGPIQRAPWRPERPERSLRPR